MRIAFVHSNRSFLSEIHNHIRFFQQYNIETEIVIKDDLNGVKRDVDWFFMGYDFGRPDEDIIRIHDYCSTSTNPLRRLKDFAKSYFNSQPDLRVFQNQFVKSSFSFHDKVPFCFRDVGVESSWINTPSHEVNKEFDFVYCGDLSDGRQPEKLIDLFTRGTLQSKTLLLLSRDYEKLQQKYVGYHNILFRGPVGHDEVPAYLRKARFGINYIPLQKPYTELTSTKFIEYVACGLPVVSTSYSWVKNFQQNYGGSYYFLDSQLSNFDFEKIVNFAYSSPLLDEWTWDEQIRRSGICEFLKANFPELDLPISGLPVHDFELKPR